MNKIPAIILAAGLSSRMGDFKPLMRLGALTLIEHGLAALQASQAISDVVIVTGHRAPEIRALLEGKPGVTLVLNNDFAAGEMISSVQRGIASLPAATDGPAAAPATGFLLMFADQPRVEPQTIASLVHHFFKAALPLAVPTYAGKRGHPIVISTTLSPEILALRNPETLKTVVQRHFADNCTLPVPDPTVLEDFDTPEDFQNAIMKYNPRRPS